jgi:DNA-binding response OmpR family regulator
MCSRILVVEDDSSLAFLLKDTLVHKGFEVVNYYDGQTATELFKSGYFDLAIVDIMLPMVDGYQLVKHFKVVDPMLPIIFLTAKSTEADKIKGFQAGADDYLTKPFSVEELNLRITAILRRSNRIIHDVLGGYIFSKEDLSLRMDEVEVVLTQRECDLLVYLIRHKNSIVKREQILKAIWGDDDYFMGRSLDVYISKLRKHLDRDKAIQIKNYHGVGFKLICE